METLNGYQIADLQSALFDHLPAQTASHIAASLSELTIKLGKCHQPIVISLGENCGPSVQLRTIGLQNALGASYFDNLVTPVEGLIKLFQHDFSNCLLLRNLHVRQWEGNDSVFDAGYGVFFHHYFYLRGHEKKRLVGGVLRRHIEEKDIPLFISSVMSQFEYLAEKLRIIARSSLEKVFVIRCVNGQAIPIETHNRIKSALDNFGASNYQLRFVHSLPFSPSQSYDKGIHHFITEDGVRWGNPDVWRRAFTLVPGP